MKRRDFIATAAAGSYFYPMKGLFQEFRHTESHGEDLINPIIPISIYPDFEKEIKMDMINLKKCFGFRRFLIVGPSKEYRYTGFPEKQVFTDIGKTVLNFKKELSKYDIEVGWWCTTTIRIGKGKFQSIVRANGTFAEEACCPLDSEYRNTFSEYVSSVVEIARPFMVNFEDDYHLSGGCYCPLHLTEFAKKEGKNYTREELQAIFQDNTPESYRILKSWGELSRDSLAGLAASVRKKVDAIAPDTRLCLCQSGASEREGNFTEAVAKAFAGKTRPMVRVYGSSYFSDDPLNLPGAIFNPLYQRQHLPDDFELIHESDSFPHTRFFMSSSKLKSFMTAAFVYGLDGTLFYTTQYLERPLEEEGYSEMYLKESARFSALKDAAHECIVEGCEIFRKPATSSNWVNIMGRHGIPYTSSGGKVKLVSGNIVEQMNDAEIRELLSGSVFLDGYAALLLFRKGYGDLTGAEISSREDTLLPPFYEGICKPENFPAIQNRLMYNYAWAFNKENKDCFYEIKALNGAEILSQFLNSRNEPFYPAMIRYENKLGGRVAVMSYNLNDNYINTRSISMFNYSKKELMRQTIEWLGKEPLPVFVKNIPNVFCIFSRSKKDNYAIIAVTGLNSDTYNSFSLDVADEWADSYVQSLTEKGIWQTIKIKKQDRTFTINEKLAVMTPVVLKLKKA